MKNGRFAALAALIPALTILLAGGRAARAQSPESAAAREPRPDRSALRRPGQRRGGRLGRHRADTRPPATRRPRAPALAAGARGGDLALAPERDAGAGGAGPDQGRPRDSLRRLVPAPRHALRLARGGHRVARGRVRARGRGLVARRGRHGSPRRSRRNSATSPAARAAASPSRASAPRSSLTPGAEVRFAPTAALEAFYSRLLAGYDPLRRVWPVDLILRADLVDAESGPAVTRASLRRNRSSSLPACGANRGRLSYTVTTRIAHERVRMAGSVSAASQTAAPGRQGDTAP